MSHFKRRLLNRVLDRLACLRTYVLAYLCACVLCVHMRHLLGVLACLACLRVQVSAVIMLLAIKKELYIHKCMLTDVSLKVEIVKATKNFSIFGFSNVNVIGQIRIPIAQARKDVRHLSKTSI